MIKVCHLSSVHQPKDTRVFFKECRSLAAAGFDVTLVVRCDTVEVIDGVRFVPFVAYKNRFKRILLSPFRMLRVALKQKAKLYHFHDPELIPVGIWLRLFGKKVIYDVHEDVPKQILDKTYIKSRAVRRFISWCAKIVEKFGVLFFSQVVAATPDIGSNFKPKKTTVVRNVPLLKLIHSDIVPEVEKTKPVVVYGGVLSRMRGLKEIVQAMEHVGGRAELWLLGKWEREEMHEECKAQKGWEHVRTFGMKPQAEAYAIMKMADMGIVNFMPLANHVNALPNKIFEYMALSLPMVLSDFQYWRENFDRCALFADPKKPEEIAARIVEYLDNPPLGQEKGKHGRDLIESGFSWEKEEAILIDLYKKLLPN